LSDSEVLKGNFSVSSNFINVDEFISNTVVTNQNTSSSDNQIVAETGVIVIPKTFEFKLNASSKKIKN
jgi:AsmA protein